MAARRVIIVRDMKNWRPQPLADKHRHDPPAWARIQTNGNMKILGEDIFQRNYMWPKNGNEY